MECCCTNECCGKETVVFHRFISHKRDLCAEIGENRHVKCEISQEILNRGQSTEMNQQTERKIDEPNQFAFRWHGQIIDLSQRCFFTCISKVLRVRKDRTHLE